VWFSCRFPLFSLEEIFSLLPPLFSLYDVIKLENLYQVHAFHKIPLKSWPLRVAKDLVTKVLANFGNTFNNSLLSLLQNLLSKRLQKVKVQEKKSSPYLLETEEESQKFFLSIIQI
jgi:hypothetical protein